MHSQIQIEEPSLDSLGGVENMNGKKVKLWVAVVALMAALLLPMSALGHEPQRRDRDRFDDQRDRRHDRIHDRYERRHDRFHDRFGDRNNRRHRQFHRELRRDHRDSHDRRFDNRQRLGRRW